MREIDYTIPHDGEEFRIVKSVYACGKVEYVRIISFYNSFFSEHHIDNII